MFKRQKNDQINEEIAATNASIEASLFNYLQDETLKRMKYHSSFNITYLEDGSYTATTNDPSFLLQLPYGQMKLSISLQILAGNPDCVSEIYFSYDKTEQFSEKNKLFIGKADGQLYERHFIFPAPIYWLRLDPINAAENFTVSKLEMHITEDDIPSEREVIDIFRKSPNQNAIQMLKQKVLEHSWQSDQIVVFVTHETTGTGAPLLCRKISAEARNFDIHTVILSLNNCDDKEMLQKFRDDCDVLLACEQKDDLPYFAAELSSLGIKYAVLNSVVSGLALQPFHAVGFTTVCLIHEMQSALKILHVQRWINDYSNIADKVVFPADCVRDEFISYGGNVAEKSVVMPQGYYKGIAPRVDSQYRINIMKKLNIPDGVKLILGAGSVNFRKGVDLLPLIALELQRIDTNEYHFLWLGESNDEQYNIILQDQIARMNLQSRFHFWGYVSDESEYMNLFDMCDALMLVSREDPYPSVMIEAMVSGIPVVAFQKSGGAQDLLADGRGYLVDYLDIAQYAQILHNICIDPGFALEVTSTAKKYIQSHGNFKEYVKSILELVQGS